MFVSHTPPDNRDSLVFQIDSLKSSLALKDSTINSFRKQLREHEERIYAVKEHIKSMYEVEEYIPTDITVIAEILDITLTKRYDVDISVTYRGTIDLPLDANIDDLSDHIEFDFTDRGADDWDFDIFQYDVDITHEEV